ncbi:MAG: hypothetical protein QNL01_08505 [Akkermansiaceae bacterium]|jgi:hypothetical protein|tara:strand:- start:17402 stop:17953 length:552 start_codon:yes stop_codon:yes gene_type:complete
MRSTSYQTTLFALVGSILFAGIVIAKPPKKPNVGQFTKLISYSPFTIKPTPPPRGENISPLERDWMLGSIRPSGNGWSVTLINKKDRKDRIRLIPGFSAGDFQLLEVKQDSHSQENSKVRVRKGSQTAWISYDEKLIKVRPSLASKASTKKTKTSSSRGGPPIPGKSSSKSSSRVRHVPKSGR